MIADLRPPMRHRRRFDVVHEGDHMRYSGLQGVRRELHAANIESPAQNKIMGRTHSKGHEIAFCPSLNHSGRSLELQVGKRSGDLVDKPCETPGSVAAHLRLTAVAVVVSHSKIGLTDRRLDQE